MRWWLACTGVGVGVAGAFPSGDASTHGVALELHFVDIGGQEVLDVRHGGLAGVERVADGAGQGVGGRRADIVEVDVVAQLLFSGRHGFILSFQLLDIFFQFLAIFFVFTFVVEIHQNVTEIHFTCFLRLFSKKVKGDL